jgi:predicted O-methyltransferase YrrM
MARDAVFYAVDPYPPGRLGISLPRIVGRREVGRIANGRVEWIREAGSKAAATAAMRKAAPFDFVFIDAAQTYELLEQEWQAWAPLVAPEGIIALHDSLHLQNAPMPEQTSVAYAREVIFPDPRFALIDSVETLAVLQRRAAV